MIYCDMLCANKQSREQVKQSIILIKLNAYENSFIQLRKLIDQTIHCNIFAEISFNKTNIKKLFL